MPWASFSMLDGPGGTGCDVPVRGCWVSRDVIVAAVYDCVTIIHIIVQDQDGQNNNIIFDFVTFPIINNLCA